ncbi:hypothetical protein [Nonomuraea ceibae]|uniref:hypothetical protein n=1 Tax=Nonomuraea ceibae TaxID=1935170 RepID=UPI001C606886|nr:hypothetical protein [Nonomuraea ceibae]
MSVHEERTQPDGPMTSAEAIDRQAAAETAVVIVGGLGSGGPDNRIGRRLRKRLADPETSMAVAAGLLALTASAGVVALVYAVWKRR